MYQNTDRMADSVATDPLRISCLSSNCVPKFSVTGDSGKISPEVLYYHTIIINSTHLMHQGTKTRRCIY